MITPKDTGSSGLYERKMTSISHNAAKSHLKTALRRLRKQSTLRPVLFPRWSQLWDQALQDVNSMALILSLRKANEAGLTEATAEVLCCWVWQNQPVNDTLCSIYSLTQSTVSFTSQVKENRFIFMLCLFEVFSVFSSSFFWVTSSFWNFR